jgi:hypothetical protein
VPKMETSVFVDSQWSGDRNPVNEYSQKGLLNKINYPTYGYSQFIYEPNSYYGTIRIYPPKEEVFLESVTDASMFTE